MIQKNDQSIYAFIDSQNLNLGVKSAGWTLDFGKFRIYLRDKYKVKKAFLFIGQVEQNQRLYQYLHDAGYELIFKPTISFKSNRQRHIKGNVDAELVLHTMIQWENFDQAIIVSGDGDFYCLVKYLDENRKLAWLMVPNKLSFSALLRAFMKKIIFINRLKEKIKKERHYPSDETLGVASHGDS